MSEEPRKSGLLPIPRWLTRAEKADFRRLESLRKEAGKPRSAADVDALADLISLRSRIGDLRSMYKHVTAELRKNPGWTSDRTFALAVARQIDAATASAHRMGRRLGIGAAD